MVCRLFWGVFFILLTAPLSGMEKQSTDVSFDAHPRHWFPHFFQKMDEEDKVSSYRLFGIWFGGDRTAYTDKICIGGSLEAAATWLDIAHNFVTAAQDFQGNHPQFLKNITLELISDPETFENHKYLLTQLRKSPYFKLTFMEEIIESLPDVKETLMHYKDGNPAVASDALRIWRLKDPGYTLNVYTDVDTFIDKMTHLERYPDYKALGREVMKGGIFRNYIDNSERCIGGSNDYLVEREAPEEAITNLKNLALEHIRDNQVLLTYYRGRSQFIASYETYRDRLENIVDYLTGEGSEKTFNFIPTIPEIGGARFWDKAVQKGFAYNTITQDNKPSAGTWRDSRPLERPCAVSDIRKSDFKNQSLHTLFTLHFMSYDHEYFGHFPRGGLFLEKLKTDATTLWGNFSDLEKFQATQHFLNNKIYLTHKLFKPSN